MVVTPVLPGKLKSGRGDWIRTSDPLRPRQVRYQAALRPDSKILILQRNHTVAQWPSSPLPNPRLKKADGRRLHVRPQRVVRIAPHDPAVGGHVPLAPNRVQVVIERIGARDQAPGRALVGRSHDRQPVVCRLAREKERAVARCRGKESIDVSTRPDCRTSHHQAGSCP